jgi:phosphoglycolate phosphatase
MKYKAVLFDLDGTLLDTLADLGESMNSVLKRYGFPEHPLESYKYHVGDGVVELCRRVLPQDCQDSGTIDTVTRAMRAEYGNRWDRKTRPYDGVPVLLDGLTVRGIRMTVLSNKPHDFTRLCVQKLLGRWHFDVVQGLEEGIQKKPDPLGALTVAKKLGFLPSDFLYLGDTNTDMRTAVAAGMYPVGALWGFRTADELTTSGAKMLIAKPMDLLKLL